MKKRISTLFSEVQRRKNLAFIEDTTFLNIYIMEQIYKPNESFDFSKLYLTSPILINGGNYLIKFKINENPLYIELPKSCSRNGILKNGKKYVCDMIFSNENDKFIKWLSDLENMCKEKLFENKDKWFESSLEEEDITDSFTPCLRSYKSNKQYLLRTNVSTSNSGMCNVKIYDENECELDVECINENTKIISILELQGIKCSVRNFQIEMEIKQMMVLNEENIFEKCLFKNFSSSSSGSLSKNIKESRDILEQNTGETLNANVSLKEPTKNMKSNPAYSSSKKRSNIHSPECNEGELSTDSLSANVDQSLEKTVEQQILAEDGEKIKDFSEKRMNKIKQNENSPECRQSNVLVGTESEFNPENFPPKDTKILSLAALHSDKYLNKKPQSNMKDDITEVDISLDKIDDNESIKLKKRNLIYYEMYKEARRRAKIARDLAISSYLEAKNIKNTYMLTDIKDSDSESENENDGEI